MGVEHPDYLCLSSSQLNDWYAYYSLEPWGFKADWNKFAMLGMVTTNSHRTSRNDPIAKLDDFMPEEPEVSTMAPVKKQSMEDQMFAVKCLIARAKKNPKIKVIERKRKK